VLVVVDDVVVIVFVVIVVVELDIGAVVLLAAIFESSSQPA